MITIKTTYLGSLRTKAVHLRSKNEIITDAPVDNKGKGEAFSPTDLLAASLGSCMLTIIGIAADTHQINLGDINIDITKMMTDNPRRVKEVVVEFYFSNTFNDKEKKIIELAALNCPVAKSLHPDLIQTVRFNYR
jgi:putative redox protein